jgi:lysophospholipase L1-like esterase
MIRVLLAASALLVLMARPQSASAGLKPTISCPPVAVAKLTAHPIVAFGDSVTWGVNAVHNCVRSGGSTRPEAAHLPTTADTTYPADLARLLHTGVLAYGVRGEATNAGLTRIAAVVAATHPSEVLLMEGFTDLLRGDTPSVIASRLILMAQIIQSYGARPVLLTLYLPSRTRLATTRVTALNAFIRNQAGTYGYRVIDLTHVFRGKPHSLAGGLYPNDSGYQVLATALAAKLESRRA